MDYAIRAGKTASGGDAVVFTHELQVDVQAIGVLPTG